MKMSDKMDNFYAVIRGNGKGFRFSPNFRVAATRGYAFALWPYGHWPSKRKGKLGIEPCGAPLQPYERAGGAPPSEVNGPGVTRDHLYPLYQYDNSP